MGGKPTNSGMIFSLGESAYSPTSNAVCRPRVARFDERAGGARRKDVPRGTEPARSEEAGCRRVVRALTWGDFYAEQRFVPIQHGVESGKGSR